MEFKIVSTKLIFDILVDMTLLPTFFLFIFIYLFIFFTQNVDACGDPGGGWGWIETEAEEMGNSERKSVINHL
jgi:hypothetical protein